MAHKETVNLYNQKNFIWLHVHIYVCVHVNFVPVTMRRQTQMMIKAAMMNETVPYADVRPMYYQWKGLQDTEI